MRRTPRKDWRTTVHRSESQFSGLGREIGTNRSIIDAKNIRATDTTANPHVTQRSLLNAEASGRQRKRRAGIGLLLIWQRSHCRCRESILTYSFSDKRDFVVIFENIRKKCVHHHWSINSCVQVRSTVCINYYGRGFSQFYLNISLVMNGFRDAR